ncbi:MAG: hypothetical protein IPH93_00955 [Saprospiraceae bacterium]|nr:hypothetical protein [Saprospiraceae bacterium]
MKISFDLDDLLIAGIKQFEHSQKCFTKIFKTELLRLGTIELFERLKAKGHKTCIYTTSLRSPFKIWLTFKIYGIVLDGIYNKNSHDKRIKEFGKTCSKYPPMFGIDIHVDDSEGVKMEAERNDFKVIIINENDTNWCDRVLAEINNYH